MDSRFEELNDMTLEDFLNEFLDEEDQAEVMLSNETYDHISWDDLLMEGEEEVKALEEEKSLVEVEVQYEKDHNLKRKMEESKELGKGSKRLKIEEKSDVGHSCSIQHCSSLKLGDPGSFVIRINFTNGLSFNALADLGASISMMPFSIYSQLGIHELDLTKVRVKLANLSFAYPRGIGRNVEVKVGSFVFKVDFMIMDMEEDPHIPIILGRPFLNTADAIVNVRNREISLGIGESRMSFIIQDVRHSYSCDPTCFKIDATDETLDELHDLLIPQVIEGNEARVGEWIQQPEETRQVTPEELGTLMQNVVLDGNHGIVPTGWEVEEEVEDIAGFVDDQIGKIKEFRQFEWETIDDAWARMKDLAMELELEDMPYRNEILKYFYDGLEEYAVEALDKAVRGKFLEVDEDMAFDLLDQGTYDVKLQEAEPNLPGKELLKLTLDRIYAFTQREGEDLDKAWERMRAMMDEAWERSPNNHFNEEFDCLYSFYEGLRRRSTMELDEAAGGYFLSKSASDCFEILNTQSYKAKKVEDVFDMDVTVGKDEEVYTLADIVGSPRKRDLDELTLDSESEDEGLIAGLTHLLDSQAKLFSKVTDELEVLRNEIKIKSSLSEEETKGLESRLDELIKMQVESPLGKFRTEEDVSVFMFIPDRFKKRRVGDKDEKKVEMRKEEAEKGEIPNTSSVGESRDLMD